MADYYTHFSCAVDGLTAKEAKWIEGTLTKNYDEAEEWPSWTDEGQIGFEWDIETDGKKRSLWIHSDGYGNPDHVVNFMKEFLKAHRPDECWGFVWSNSCSRPRLDGFGGGGVFITATTEKWFDAQSLVDKEISKHKEKKHASTARKK